MASAARSCPTIRSAGGSPAVVSKLEPAGIGFLPQLPRSELQAIVPAILHLVSPREDPILPDQTTGAEGEASSSVAPVTKLILAPAATITRIVTASLAIVAGGRWTGYRACTLWRRLSAGQQVTGPVVVLVRSGCARAVSTHSATAIWRTLRLLERLSHRDTAGCWLQPRPAESWKRAGRVAWRQIPRVFA